MSRVEFVLIGTDEGFEAVSGRIGALLDTEPDTSRSSHDFRLAGGGWASLDDEPVDPWADDRLRGYRWQVSVGGLPEHRQEDAARSVYELLASGTPWALGLTYDHADALVAARSAQGHGLQA